MTKKLKIGVAVYLNGTSIQISKPDDWGWLYQDQEDYGLWVTIRVRKKLLGGWKSEIIGHSEGVTIDSITIDEVDEKNGLPYSFSATIKIGNRTIHAAFNQHHRVPLNYTYCQSLARQITALNPENYYGNLVNMKKKVFLVEDSGYYPTRFFFVLGATGSGKTCWFNALQTNAVRNRILGNSDIRYFESKQPEQTSPLPTQVNEIEFQKYYLVNKKGEKEVAFIVDVSGEVSNLHGNSEEDMNKARIRVDIERYASGIFVVRNEKWLSGDKNDNRAAGVLYILTKFFNESDICYILTGADRIKKAIEDDPEKGEQLNLTPDSPIFKQVCTPEQMTENKAITSDIMRRISLLIGNSPCFVVSSCSDTEDGKLDFSQGYNAELPLVYMLEREGCKITETAILINENARWIYYPINSGKIDHVNRTPEGECFFFDPMIRSATAVIPQPVTPEDSRSGHLMVCFKFDEDELDWFLDKPSRIKGLKDWLKNISKAEAELYALASLPMPKEEIERKADEFDAKEETLSQAEKEVVWQFMAAIITIQTVKPEIFVAGKKQRDGLIIKVLESLPMEFRKVKIAMPWSSGLDFGKISITDEDKLPDISAPLYVITETSTMIKEKFPEQFGVAAVFYFNLRAAERGDSEAQRRMGLMYDTGKGVPQNYSEAMKWYSKSAEQGDSEAQRFIGEMYYFGKGVPQNYSEAMKWCLKAAEQGNSDAQCRIGFMYSNGEGVPQNYSEAVKWYLKSAEQGNHLAQCSMGLSYAEGEIIPQNYSEAMRWFLKSAEQGNSIAQWSIGFMYYDGEGVSQNYSEAMKWCLKAAEQGDSDAQRLIGIMYYNGEGVSRDLKEARKWLEKSAAHGNSDAKNFLAHSYH